MRNDVRVLDIGIGKAWWEEFLLEKGFRFNKVVGMDVSEQAIAPRKRFIEYHLTRKFAAKSLFEFVFCLDALPLLSNKNLFDFCAPNGFVVACVPFSKRAELGFLRQKGMVKAEGIVGKRELDAFGIVQKPA